MLFIVFLTDVLFISAIFYDQSYQIILSKNFLKDMTIFMCSYEMKNYAIINTLKWKYNYFLEIKYSIRCECISMFNENKKFW